MIKKMMEAEASCLAFTPVDIYQGKITSLKKNITKDLATLKL